MYKMYNYLQYTHENLRRPIMQQILLKYGEALEKITLDEKKEFILLKSAAENMQESEEVIIEKALKNPIDSPKLIDLIKPGYKVCIVIPDITRMWQKPAVYLPFIIKEIEKCKVASKDIKFLCALGTHRKQTEEEHRMLIGDELYERFQIVDHDCNDEESLVYVGTTSFGTSVKVNKMALDCDLLIITGGIVFHDMAGFGGGRKSILPGISGYETIMANHALSLNPNSKGINPMAKCASMTNNPLNEDMTEAANFVKPDFLFNVVMDSEGSICKALAGNFITAHLKGCEELEKLDGVYIEEKGDLVIASSGGYPKDIDLYQASKTLSNAKEAVNEGGTMIILAKCVEGIGHPDVLKIIMEHDNNESREKELRQAFTIAKYAGYLVCDIAEKYNLILVSGIDRSVFKNSKIQVVNSIQEAFDRCFFKEKDFKKIYIMPNGANTFPMLK